jgi:predicted nucleic acid-binding protein
MKYLVDTCVLCELQKRRPDRSVVAWFRRRFADSMFMVSAVTIAEIKRGINRLDESDPRRQKLSEWLENDILSQYGDSIIPFDLSVSKMWGEIMAKSDRAGETRPSLDAQIVATALVHDLVIVTRNVRDLDFAGATVVNPWNG